MPGAGTTRSRPPIPPEPDGRLRSFSPFVDARSRILILGTMPGPEALRKQEYYGFPGNHFWRIMSDLFAGGRTLDYPAKLGLLRRQRIALWDVLESCERRGALDSAIRDDRPNAIPELLARCPGIRAIFLNGKTAAKKFERYFGGRLALPATCLPSTSPANASISYPRKRQLWTAVAAALAVPARATRTRRVRR